MIVDSAVYCLETFILKLSAGALLTPFSSECALISSVRIVYAGER